MSAEGFHVNVEQLRAHAKNVEAVKARFEAVKAASAHIAQDDQAYGFLCGWIAGVLEGRHTRQDELLARLENNLRLVAESLRASADAYQATEDGSTTRISSIGRELP